MKWTGFEASDEFRAFYLINRSTNAREFEAGVRELEVPGQNVVYADTFGNVGHWVAARIPVRREIDPMFPLPGWTSEAEWRGFIPFGQLPRSWNPTEGFIASANNPFVGENYPQYVSELWEPPSRITRIRELLNSAEKLNSEDCERFQTDILSPHGKEFTEHLLRVFPNQETTDPILSTALEYLRNWDFRYSRDNIAPTVISSTFVRFLQNVFKDELGDTLFTLYTAFSAVPHRVTSRMLESDSSGWFDDIATPEVESKDDILRRSLLDALQELQSIMGPDTKLWRWGELHTVTFVHPFGRQKPLDRVFNIGPFSIGGSSSTIRKSDFRLSKPYAVTVGPSVRHVIDLGNRSSFLSVITAGASGQVLHEHYDDQSVLWLNGGYHTFITEWDMISQAGWDRLVLRPE